MAKLIPIRPSVAIGKLSQAEQNCLTWYVLSGCNRDSAFEAFVRPDLTGTSLLGQYASQFFSSKPAIDYIEAYTNTIDNAIHPKEAAKPKLTKEEQDKRNAEAVQKVVNWVISHSDNIDSMEHPEELIKMMQRLGMLGDDTVVEEAPRRYLPEMCSRCRYKSFCESECEDDCQFCRYKQYSEENGVFYTPETQLNK